MSEVVSVLEKMASDAAMSGESAIADLVATNDINDGQQQAILAQNVEKLKETIVDLPKVKCFAILPAEDDEAEEEQETDNSGKNNEVAIAVNG